MQNGTSIPAAGSQSARTPYQQSRTEPPSSHNLDPNRDFAWCSLMGNLAKTCLAGRCNTARFLCFEWPCIPCSAFHFQDWQEERGRDVHVNIGAGETFELNIRPSLIYVRPSRDHREIKEHEMSLKSFPPGQ